MRKFDSLLDVMRDATVVRLTPRALARPGARLWGLLELSLPGSMKDRVALRIVEEAEARGDLRPGDTLVESSSGSMAEGLARVGALKGYQVVIVTDPRIDPLTAAKLRALGARLEIVDSYDPVGGWQTSRLRRLGEVLERHPRAFWARQYDSPGNPGAYAEVGAALAEAFGPALAALVGTVGSGGSLGGLSRVLRRRLPRLRVAAVDAAGSVLFHQPDRRRLQSGHGNSVVPGNLDYAGIDEVHWLTDGEAFDGCRELARRAGVFGGGSSGAAYVVASWMAAQFEPGRDVVVVLPDRGDRYHASIYDDAFLAEHGLAQAAAAPEPVALGYGEEVAERWSRAELPHDGRTAYHHPNAAKTADLARALGLAGEVAADLQAAGSRA